MGNLRPKEAIVAIGRGGATAVPRYPSSVEAPGGPAIFFRTAPRRTWPPIIMLASVDGLGSRLAAAEGPLLRSRRKGRGQEEEKSRHRRIAGEGQDHQQVPGGRLRGRRQQGARA